VSDTVLYLIQKEDGGLSGQVLSGCGQITDKGRRSKAGAAPKMGKGDSREKNSPPVKKKRFVRSSCVMREKEK